MLLKISIGEILQGSVLKTLGLRYDNNVIYNEHIRTRRFITRCNDHVVISDNLSEINADSDLEINADAQDFYLRYGFIAPPFTLYKNVYLLAPYIGVVMSNPLTFKTLYPVRHSFDNENAQHQVETGPQLLADLQHSLAQNESDYQVLFSGGLDSSLLLGISNQLNKTRCAIHCFMASMPQETTKAKKMCADTATVFKHVSIESDLSAVAGDFIRLTLEPVADKIALVIPALVTAAKAETGLAVLDGQGADSLFCGLPHDKLYDLYRRRGVRALSTFGTFLPVWKNKSSHLGRKIYRATKVLKCLAAPTPAAMLIQSLAEDTAIILLADNEVIQYLESELAELSKNLDDFHLVIRYLFMFRILPAREMQKYLLAESLNYAFKLPFLEKTMVDKYFYLDASCSIKQGIYKYPITCLAKTFWPGFLNSSRTSPFQVEFTTEKLTVKQFSLNCILKKTQ